MRMNVPSAPGASISLQSILFATDFSAASMLAMPYATAMARKFNSKLFLLHVVPPEDYASGCKSLEEAAQIACRDAKVKLDTLLQSASCRDIVCETEIGSGDIWLGLNELIRRQAIDLLVMGTVGRRGAKKVFLGSVAEEAMRESRCPALTVGPQIRAARTTDFQQILYATDFSDDSLAGLPYALSFAERYTSRLVLVHALEGLSESPYLDGRMATVQLRELLPSRLPSAGAPEIMVEMGSPANVIIEAAEKVAADLIVIGARGAGSLARLASHFGSVAHKIVCRAACPVLTVRRFVEIGTKPTQTQTARTRH
jgi:nucleotide-binding universal stress UspA family protein